MITIMRNEATELELELSDYDIDSFYELIDTFNDRVTVHIKQALADED